VKELKKLPLHMALVVNEAHVSHVDLARLVNWCFAVGTHCVSLYDPRGVLRHEMETLRHAVEQEHANLFSSAYEQLIVSSSDDCQESTPHHDVHSLLVLGPEDGLSALANTARSLCESVQQHRTAVSEIDSSLINNKLIGTHQGYPDPNLAVVIGTPHSLLGYLPWHTRLTEILFITSHHKITYQQFHSLLCRYANTTQRHGK
jgi:dehydrodolichyl diphosphate syntase complex subunit NUS1